MKGNFWLKDWFPGLLLALLFIVLSPMNWFQSLERATYDMGVRSADGQPANNIAIIGIDDQSLENMGRWPWSRDVHAHMIDLLGDAGARVIGYTLLLSEPQQDPGLEKLQSLADWVNTSPLASNTPQRLSPLPEDAVAPTDTPPLQTALVELQQRIETAINELDTDSQLADSLGQAGNTVLAMQMNMGTALGKPDKPLPDYLSNSALLSDMTGAQAPSAIAVVPPIQRLGEQARAVGHAVTLLDVDGAVRMEPLVLDYYGQLFPSLALHIAALSLNLSQQDITVLPGQVHLGNLSIETDPYAAMYSFFYANKTGQDAFKVDSFYDVYSGKINADKYRDKIVLVGATAFGLGSKLKTPLAGTQEPVEILAHNVSSILNEDFFVRPAWADAMRWGLFFLVALYLMLLLPKLSAALGATVSLVALATITLAEIIVMSSQGIWLPLMLPAALLFTGHIALTTKRYLLTEKSRDKSQAESAESNRMLGLAFQQQNQLDMAFDKFRRAPLDAETMDLLYNLALDFERKRQFNKAASVYHYMSTFDADFKDIKQRSQRATNAQETMIFGQNAIGSSGTTDTLLGSAGAEFEKPMLGRYQVEKELGRGAMGIVYQGRDPKINRVVAIKTLALSQEFEEEELAEVRDRFFREAEAAGRLNHPNIVTVYDAGEEHDLAYIAMEFLQGHDLASHVRADTLLPLTKVLHIIGKAAEALGYAHSQEIVHRDIKPANIMLDPDKGTIKITDFGIARVSNTSRTKTGMVVGTPSYMSPEQVTGKKVDGRSDLFSLGVMMYQLLTGSLPFEAENPTQVMYKIATEPHPDIFQARPALKRSAPWVSIVINRALAKDLDKRYQTGEHMAKDIRVVLHKMAQARNNNPAAQ